MAIRFTPGGESKYVLIADRGSDTATAWMIAPLNADDFAAIQDILGQGTNKVATAALVAFRGGLRSVTGFPGEPLPFMNGRITEEGVMAVRPSDRLEIGQAIITLGMLEPKEGD